ncbi:MAG: AAA family ATPase [Rhodospirillales bacterium]|nr:AAA family ATPase [Rhodospirillales bacterium]
MTDSPPTDLDWLDFNNAPDALPKSSKKIDAEDIKARLLSSLESTLHSLYPYGKIEGKHFVIGDVLGTEGQSLKINLKGQYKGCWKDFDSGEGGDIFSLFAAVFSIDAKKDFKKLLERISEWLGDPVQFYREAVYKDRSAGSTAQRGAPEDTLGMWVAKYDYYDRHGNLIACVYKYILENGKKTFRCWDVRERKWKAPDPRPLYNLPGINDADLVFLVEGEKCADALIAAGYCATTLIGGSQNPIEKTDLSPLLGKIVCIWPDNDESGKKYAENMVKHLQELGVETIKLLIPPQNAPGKWDVADAYEQNFNVPAFIETAVDGVGYYFEPPKIRVSSFGDMYEDPTPMPPDVIGPRILGHGDIGIIAGASKVGKSHFVLSAAMHWAAGKSFLDMTVDRPLRILYMQAEIGYFYMRERIRKFYPELAQNPDVHKNLVISDKFPYCLDDEGKEEFIRIGLTAFKDDLPDLLIIDPLRNVFYSEKENATENDNTAMIEFFRNGIVGVQRSINPLMPVIIPHHINKMPPKLLAEEPFNAISGAGSIRGYYTAGIIIHKPVRNAPEIDVYYELRNGPGIPKKRVVIKDNQWIEIVDENETEHTQNRDRKNKSHRDYRLDKIEEILEKEAVESGKLYTRAAFAKKFEDKHGLKSTATIQRDLQRMFVIGRCKFTNEGAKYDQDPAPTKDGYVVTENMLVKIDGKRTRVTPTHFVKDNNMVLHEVENPHVWVTNEKEADR